MKNNNFLLIIILALGFGLFAVYEIKSAKTSENTDFPGGVNPHPFPDSNINPPTIVPPTTPSPIASPEADPTNYNEALQLAKKNGKKMVLMFSADSCTWCRKFKSEVLPDNSVKSALSNYVFYIVNTDIDRGTTSKYGVNRLPTFVIADNNENKLKTNQGYMEISEFISWLNSGSPSTPPPTSPPPPTGGPGENDPEPGRRPGIIIRRPRNPGCPNCPPNYESNWNGFGTGGCSSGWSNGCSSCNR